MPYAAYFTLQRPSIAPTVDGITASRARRFLAVRVMPIFAWPKYPLRIMTITESNGSIRMMYTPLPYRMCYSARGVGGGAGRGGGSAWILPEAARRAPW